MSNLIYLGAAMGLSALGICVLWLVRRRPRSMQAGMDAFNRELQALAPREPRKHGPGTGEPPAPSPIRPRPTEADRPRSRSHNDRSSLKQGDRRGARPSGFDQD